MSITENTNGTSRYKVAQWRLTASHNAHGNRPEVWSIEDRETGATLVWQRGKFHDVAQLYNAADGDNARQRLTDYLTQHHPQLL